MKMDACPFNIQMKGQTLKEGKKELVDIFGSVGIEVGDLRVVEVRKGRGASEYTEVTVTADLAVVKWWAPTGRDHDKGGTIMIEGTEQLYLRLMEQSPTPRASTKGGRRFSTASRASRTSRR